jgi:uncharacterized membrane protein YphA (DoxX/SURF4 family)
MRRLFYFFPGGLPGVGLLLLRGMIAVSLLFHAISFARAVEPGLLEWLFIVGVSVIGMGLLIGFMTPFLAITVALSAIILGLEFTSLIAADIFHVNRELFYLVTIALALAALGPGAFSLDARMFGRREIRIPRSREVTTNSE